MITALVLIYLVQLVLLVYYYYLDAKLKINRPIMEEFIDKLYSKVDVDADTEDFQWQLNHASKWSAELSDVLWGFKK
jgi:hypothetical protein